MSVELTDDEIKGLIKNIGEPTFKFFMRRISNEILKSEKYKHIEINSFLTIVAMAMSTIDANMLRFLQNFYKIQTKEDIDFEKLKHVFTKNLYSQLNQILQ